MNNLWKGSKYYENKTSLHFEKKKEITRLDNSFLLDKKNLEPIGKTNDDLTVHKTFPPPLKRQFPLSLCGSFFTIDSGSYKIFSRS